MEKQPIANEDQTKLWLKWVLAGSQIGLAYLLIFGLTAFVAVFFLDVESRVDLVLGLSLASYISFLLWLVPLFFLLDRHQGRRFSLKSMVARLDLGRPTWRAVSWGLVIILATLQLVGFLAAAFDWLGLVDSSQSQTLFEFVPAGGWELFWFFVPTCLLVPVIEEIVFRRWLFKPLDKRFGLWPALVVSSVVFGLAHFDPASPGAIIWTAFLGLALAGVYRWSNNLWVPIIMHITVNALAVAGYVLGY